MVPSWPGSPWVPTTTISTRLCTSIPAIILVFICGSRRGSGGHTHDLNAPFRATASPSGAAAHTYWLSRAPQVILLNGFDYSRAEPTLAARAVTHNTATFIAMGGPQGLGYSLTVAARYLR